MALLWVGFVVLVLGLLALDLGVLHRGAHVDSIGRATGWSVFWIGLGLAFSGVIYMVYEGHWLGAALHDGPAGAAAGGWEALVDYLTAYLLEKSLSIDNLFVIALIFASFGVAPEHQHRVLFWGIVGALVLRGAMILGGVWLVRQFEWILYVFGVYLVYAGARIAFAKHSTAGPGGHWSVRLARRILPIASGPHGGRFTTRENGRFHFTELVIVLFTVELTDVVFAVDSVPAVLAITTEPFLVITSNVFAILGLRALYFVLAGMITSFRFLKPALALLLVYVGGKMIAHDHVHIPNLVSLGVILGVVAIGVVASLLFPARPKAS